MEDLRRFQQEIEIYCKYKVIKNNEIHIKIVIFFVFYLCFFFHLKLSLRQGGNGHCTTLFPMHHFKQAANA